MGFPQVGLQEALVFDVRAYGAVGDGMHDDTAAINNCGTKLAATGGGIRYFPPGTYYLGSGPIIPLGDVWDLGAGIDVTILTTNGTLVGGYASLIRAANTTPPYPANYKLSDMTVDGSAATTADAVQLEGVDYLEVARIKVINAYARGITIGSVGGLSTGPTFIAAPHLHDIQIINSRTDDAIGGGGITDLAMENIWVTNPGTDGGDITNVTRGQIRNYHVVQSNPGSTYAGLSSDFGWQDVDVDGLYVTGMGLVGLFQTSTISGASPTKNLSFSGVHGSNIQGSFFRFVGVSGSPIVGVDLSDIYAEGWNSNDTGSDGVTTTYVNGFRWRGGLVGSPTNGAYGIGLDSNTEDVLIEGTDLSVIGGAAFRPFTLTGTKIVNCPGFNPVGSAVPGTAFTLPASGTAWTNNTGVDGTLWVTGAGTVTDVVLQGVTVGSSLSVGQSYFVPAGGTITFTYSVAPTLVFVGN